MIGFAPLMLYRAALYLMAYQSPLSVALHRHWLPISLLEKAWLIVFPLSIVSTRRISLPQRPRPRAILVEALFALLATPVVFMVGIAVFVIVANLFVGMVSPTDPWGPRTRSFNQIEWLAFIALAVAVAPLAEEVFHRGMLYNALRQRIHPILAAPLQAIVFGFLHPFDLASRAFVVTGGLALALVYEWRKTLLAPILLHVAINAVGMTYITWAIAADAAAPRLGVRGEAHKGGCLVTEVAPGSTAATANLQVGDVITAVDGEPVADILRLSQVIRRKRVGDTVSVEFIRGGKAQRVDAVLKGLKQ
jgi:membrane protease YdiL (CAAX protease family)